MRPFIIAMPSKGQPAYKVSTYTAEQRKYLSEKGLEAINGSYFIISDVGLLKKVIIDLHAKSRDYDVAKSFKAELALADSILIIRTHRLQPTQAQLERAERMPAEAVAALDKALKALAAMDEDYASEKNGHGFNRSDRELGHALATTGLNNLQEIALGISIIIKYHRQLKGLYHLIFRHEETMAI